MSILVRFYSFDIYELSINFELNFFFIIFLIYSNTKNRDPIVERFHNAMVDHRTGDVGWLSNDVA